MALRVKHKIKLSWRELEKMECQPIVEANVGMNLIISHGEVVAYKWGNDQITTAIVEIPRDACEDNARELEQIYLQQQKTEMVKRYEQTMNKS